ncbi:hypothetical protein Syun_007839 [Stephania yunnanensis]|uniref:NAC domain-containing protein n=1 Tax=Stephania yunnanensis TaxID=152371 RepID=A0AAP0PZ49_9MAGN
MKNNYWNGLSVGYRFKPTDYELISYLREQVKGQLPAIREIIVTNKVYKKEPWNLRFQLESEKLAIDDVYMYFFVMVMPRVRGAGRGHWHASSGVNKIFDPPSGELVGETRSLVYNFTPSEDECFKSNWIMHEYRLKLPKSDNKEGYWTLCSIGKTGKSEVPVPDEVERKDRANFLPDQESIVEGQRAYNAPEGMYNEPQPAYYESYALDDMYQYMVTQSAYYQPNAAAPEGMVHMGDQNELIPPELVEALSFKPQY